MKLECLNGRQKNCAVTTGMGAANVHLEKEIFSGYRIDALAYSEGEAFFTG